MGLADYIILAVVAACVVTAIAFIVRQKRKGKNICCGSRSNCQYCCNKKK